METVHFCGKSPNNLIFLVKNSTYFHSYLLFFVILHQQRVVVNYLFVYIDLVAKFARILAIVVISIIFVNIILFISFSIPAVQKHAADFALEKLEPVIGTEARLEGIRIRLFNTVELKGLYVEDQQQDTLLYAGKLTVRIHAMDLLRNKLSVRKVGLEILWQIFTVKHPTILSTSSYNRHLLTKEKEYNNKLKRKILAYNG